MCLNIGSTIYTSTKTFRDEIVIFTREIQQLEKDNSISFEENKKKLC